MPDWCICLIICLIVYKKFTHCSTEVSNIVQVAAFVLGADGAALPQGSLFLNGVPKPTVMALAANAGVESG